MAADYHTQQGFQALQLRLLQTLKTLADEKGVRLIEFIWMGGTGSLPTLNGPVSLTLVQSSGEQERVTLDGADLKAWLAGASWPNVDRKLAQALNALAARRPR
jgi:hypothetical protein